MKKMILVVSLSLVCFLTGCQESPPPESSDAAIQWFEGGVGAAFATAKSAGKPVFLYWGAEWCPPCHNLKINYFTRPEFIDAIQRFVPVYLDGDTESAQLWAERYGITGYPTVILFSPTSVELFRMPSDVTPEQYGALLEASISNFRPVHLILSEVIEGGPQAVSHLDLELIAYHSWLQDPNSSLSDSDAIEIFWQIYSEAPDLTDRLRARFMILTLERAMPKVWAAAPDFDEGSLATLDDAQMKTLRSGLTTLLESPELWSDNKIFLTLQARRTIQTLEPEPSTGRNELVDDWLAVARNIQNHPEYSTTEQLMAFVPEFELQSMQRRDRTGDSIPASLQEKVRERAEMVLSSASDPGEFQSTLNMLVWLHTMAGLEEESADLLEQHMNETTAPHYFLSILGDLSADSPEAAIKWHRLAFENSGPGSARVKWGSTYILKLVQFTPDNSKAIESASQQLITELAAFEDAFAGRNHTYLSQLDQALKTWAGNTGNESVVGRLRRSILEQCDRFGNQMDPVQYERCMGFLSDG